MESFATILAAIDFSENSDCAFDLAVLIATAFNSRLVVLHVIDNSLYAHDFYTPYPSMAPYPSIVELTEELRESAKSMMAKFCEARLSGFSNYTSVIDTGTPFREIIQAAEKAEASLIVIGTHGRSGLDRLVFGSTAERVVRGAPCSVLTVPLKGNRARNHGP
jgi:nucleotide-binding universal stress UspA family protein